eukprot:gnl/TRDRNA2_/TRDRNA2_166673_c0_seq2.p1 gnl/TRDRNA2_/TRDRNA2_166673_c0~~gnl/TRDRNA2_/TRDRNA2_166673_c0_seq2.p1  ORF type:complete len:346 (+),score=37.76 gnl/TRDRNA2_/TRDRNA2_166673_c0_seq2:435-1472(+)
MGRIWFENWRYDKAGQPVTLSSRVMSLKNKSEQTLSMRLDFAAADLGRASLPGLFLIAGGCGDHPRRCQRPDGFFKSAMLYDSLLEEWQELPHMPTRRHGPAAACTSHKVYVLGGQYVDEHMDEMVDPSTRFCDVFDVSQRSWQVQALPDTLDRRLKISMSRAAFFGADAIGERVVACVKDATFTIAFNSARPSDGWRLVEFADPALVETIRAGTSSCACSYQGELIVASGRPEAFARSVAAFRFVTESESDEANWHCGEWRQLPDLNHARVGGALLSVEGRLYVMGGVDEETGEFRNDAERFDNHLSPPRWTPVPWFKMPRALHAQQCVALPWLARNFQNTPVE